MVSPELPVLRVAYPDAEALQAEIEENLQHGRLFIHQSAPDCEERSACRVDIMLRGGTRSVSIEAEVVWLQADNVGVQFTWDASLQTAFDGLMDSASDTASSPEPRNVHEKIRGLSTVEQQKLARDGTLAERVALERRYGKAVWETLLNSGRLSPPEVAKIARNGTLPKPLVDIIVSNQGWLANGEVRRALLSNPRCSGSALTRVLRALPQHELKQIEQQTAYPRQVQVAARRLLGKRS